jgi:hypothetical protein
MKDIARRRTKIQEAPTEPFVFAAMRDARTTRHEAVVAAGMSVLSAMLEEDPTKLCGPRYVTRPSSARVAGRAHRGELASVAAGVKIYPDDPESFQIPLCCRRGDRHDFALHQARHGRCLCVHACMPESWSWPPEFARDRWQRPKTRSQYACRMQSGRLVSSAFVFGIDEMIDCRKIEPGLAAATASASRAVLASASAPSSQREETKTPSKSNVHPR